MLVHRSHKIRLLPNNKQATYFSKACGTARFAYNWGLAEWKRQYEAGEKPSAYKIKAKFNDTKGDDFPWTRDVTKCAPEQAFNDLGAAFKNFFRNIKAGRKPGYPRFKKRGTNDSFYLSNDKFSVDGKKVRIPKLGPVRMAEELRFKGKILSATVSRHADLWFVAINVELEIPVPIPSENQAVGVDLGVKDLATLSDGTKIQGGNHHKESLGRLRMLNKSLSRKQRGSANWVKAKRKLSRLHASTMHRRSDEIHKLTTSLVSSYGFIAMEDLNVAGMVRNRHLARAISDQGFRELRRQLEYKALASGVELVFISRWFPSSKRCNDCGTINEDLTLADREWVCVGCGVVHDRDVNAACNILAEGSSVSACGDSSSGFPSIRGTKLPSEKQEVNVVGNYE